MSAKVTIRTNMRSEEQIIAALHEMGVPADQIEHVPEGRDVVGYKGSNWGLAQVLIRQSWHGGYSEVGFARQPDGTYAAIVDHIDEHHLCGRLPERPPARTGFSQHVGQWYAATAVRKALKTQGFQTTIRRDGANLRVLAHQY